MPYRRWAQVGRVVGWAAVWLAAMTLSAAEYRAELPRPPRRGKPRPPVKVRLWLPDGIDYVRGLLAPGTVVIDHKLPGDPRIRAACKDMDMGIVSPGIGMPDTQPVLDELAEKSGHPEVAQAPLLTTGHSAAGIWCRNVAYLDPDRVLGVIMIKSGNFQDGLPDLTKTLAGVPVLCINGEFEQYGPAGGDLGAGLRSEYSLNQENPKKQNQTQWVMVRMQIMDRRRKNPRNMMSLVVDRGGHHTSWNAELSALTAQFIRSAAGARLPDGRPDPSGPRPCKPLALESGWLGDPDIKNPSRPPAPYNEYRGDKTRSFWYPDRALAEAVFAYHGKGWEVPDPTAGLPDEERYVPPPVLRDMIDAPPPPPLAWKGGAGTWDPESAHWRRDGEAVSWDSACRAVIEQAGSVVTLTNRNLACLGLTLGKGTVLDLGERSLRVRWHATLEKGSEIRVALPARGRPARRGRLVIEGRPTLGGRLVIAADPAASGVHPIVGSRTGFVGAFDDIVLPEGWISEVTGHRITVRKPAPPGK